LAPVGFHIRHIAGSIDRLTTYLKGKQLTVTQLEALRSEMDPGADREALLRALTDSMRQSEAAIRSLDTAAWGEARFVGRKQLPTTVAGLLVHLAEYTQRHVGQAIITAKVAAARK